MTVKSSEGVDKFLSVLERRGKGVNKVAGLFLTVAGVTIITQSDNLGKIVGITVIGLGAGLLGRPQLAKMVIDYFKGKPKKQQKKAL